MLRQAPLPDEETATLLLETEVPGREEANESTAAGDPSKEKCVEEEDWRAWQSFLVQWGLVFTLMLVALVLLPYILKSLGYAVDVRDATETLRHAGWYGVLLFNFMFTMGQLMRMPGFIFLIIGGITWGVYGLIVNVLALPVVLGVQFVIYRKIGGDSLTKIRSPLLKKVLVLIEQRPITIVTILRLCFLMSPMLNMLLSMTNIRFREYMIGSFLGLLPVLIVLTTFAQPAYDYMREYTDWVGTD